MIQATPLPTLPDDSILTRFNDIVSGYQNIIWVLGFLIVVGMVLYYIIRFTSKCNQNSLAQIERFRANGKYIEQLYVEIDGTKEVIRFFIFEQKWKERIIHQFNTLFDNTGGHLLRQFCVNDSFIFELRRNAKMSTALAAVKKNASVFDHFEKSIRDRTMFTSHDSLHGVRHFHIAVSLKKLHHTF